jgi:hypothetical protein
MNRLGVLSAAWIIMLSGPAAAIAQETGLPHESPVDTIEGQRATKALNILANQNFDSFSNFGPAGDNFVATVRRGNMTFDVLIDPDRGTVEPLH